MPPKNTEISNRPLWTGRKHPEQGGFQEVWYLKLNDPASGKALWLRFTLLQSKNGFKKVAETWGIFFQPKEGKELFKVAVKQTQDLTAFQSDGQQIQIGECVLSDRFTRGKIHSKGHALSWDLQFVAQKPDPGMQGSFNLVPKILSRPGIVKNTAWTVFEDLRFSGSCTIDDESHSFALAPGMQGHLAGPKNGHSWVWGHCNHFVDQSGAIVPIVFEGLTGKASVAGLFSTPALSSFYFYYQGKEYFLNSLWHAIRSRSKHTITDWQFEAEDGGLLFKGHIQADLRSFAGITYEDTNGSLLYCANSKCSEMNLLIYRNGKLETSLQAPHTAAFEVVSREKNPYVPLLI